MTKPLSPTTDSTPGDATTCQATRQGGPGLYLLTVYLAPTAAAVLGLGLILQLFPYQHDDAYITYRYAQVFLQEGIFSFNPGGEPTEGFSTPLWMFLAAVLGTVFGAEQIHLTGPLFGSASYIVLGVLPWWQGRGLGVAESALSSALILSMPGLIYYAGTGMESVFFTLLCTIATVAMAPSATDGNEKTVSLWVCAVLVLTAWTRPEAPWLGVNLVLALIWLGSGGVYRLYPYFIALVAGLLTLLVWRYATFGEWLPNTYYAKVADHAAAGRYLFDAVTAWWYAPWLLAGLAGAVLGQARHRFLLVAGLGWMLAAWLEGGDWMPLGRFLLTAQVLFALAAAGLLERVPTPAWPGALLGLAAAVIAYAALQSPIAAIEAARATVDREAAAMRHWLQAQDVAGVALVDIGQHAYYGGFHILDLAGLTDRVIARRVGPHLEKPVYGADLLRRDIDAVVLRIGRSPQFDEVTADVQLAAQDFFSNTERQLFTDADFQRDYRAQMVFLPDYPRSPLGGLAVFMKVQDPELPAPAPAVGWFPRPPGL